MTFSEKLRTIRMDRGISQKKLADMIGVSQTAVYSWEKGTRIPKMQQLVTLANIFNITLNDLLDDVDKFTVTHTDQDNTIEFTPKSTTQLYNITRDIVDKTINEYFNNFSLESISANEDDLLLKYRILNNLGKEEALKRVSELTEIKKYTEKPKKKIQAVYKPKE